ncbi:MAG TPA: carboxypeptidase-like regulatory domain-containing protein, partial [Candidatus Acidoferrales bacterium]|nr:carboxypeptidase-like regulatory domain-containing protein [Candidatus Acidoferrales bacterium]
MRTVLGVPILGSTVRLVEISTGKAWVTWTDENGKFEVPGLPAGRYRVGAQQLGFEPASAEFTLPASRTEKQPPIELTLRIRTLSPAENQTPPSATTGPGEPSSAVPEETLPKGQTSQPPT